MKRVITGILLSFVSLYVYGKYVPALPKEDKARIKEALLINEKYGDRIWKGISTTGFSLILVTDSIEYLLFHPNPTPDFEWLEEDKDLGTKIYWRKRQFATGLLATFPAVAGVNCMVVGTPANTGKNTTEWIIALLHEHFHQYVYSRPGYYEAVKGLDLSGGDETGRWMLNYPFPYTDNKVMKQYEKYTTALKDAVENESPRQYIRERKKFTASLRPPDYRYFSFQLWQEGIARYTEYKFLELMKDYVPGPVIRAMPDFIAFEAYKSSIFTNELTALKTVKLSGGKRVCFYSAGFAEGLLLDRLNPAWRELYLADRFFLEKYLPAYK